MIKKLYIFGAPSLWLQEFHNAVPRFQLLTRSIKAETCKTIHRPQYLSMKKKDNAESRRNWKEWEGMVPTWI